MTESTIYFNHIPKTAGTSLRVNLERLYPSFEHNNYWYLSDYINDNRANLAKYKLLCGHFGMAPIMLGVDRKYQLVTILRDPLKRSYSHYLHIKNNPPSAFAKFILDECSFEEFLFSPIAESELMNFQARYLGMTRLEELFARLYGVHYTPSSSSFERTQIINNCSSIDVRDRALAVINDSWFVGLTEKYEDSVRVLGNKIGVHMDYQVRLNVAQDKTSMPELSKTGQSRLEWLNEIDAQLYRHAENKFKEVSEDFGGEVFSPNRKLFNSHIDFSSGFIGGGWLPVERVNNKFSCWSYSCDSWIAFLLNSTAESELLVRCATWLYEDMDCLFLTVNGQRVEHNIYIDPTNENSNFRLIHAKFSSDFADINGVVKVVFNLSRLIKPIDFGDPKDDRELGLYVSWARLISSGDGF